PAHPNGNGNGNGNANGQGSHKPGSGISYHGGPIMLGTTNVYYIWYGDWGGNSATTILADLANHIGGSPYYNINTTYYNGGHTHGTISGSDIKFAFIGNPDRCPSACAAQSTGPNGNAGADGMASIISHELEEAVSDPDLNAWYDRQGMENADKCAWTFGSMSTASN